MYTFSATIVTLKLFPSQQSFLNCASLAANRSVLVRALELSRRMLRQILNAVFLLLLLSPVQSTQGFPRGHIHSLLHAQGLSHFAFHSVAFKRALARLFAAGKGSAAAVVGVENGKDVIDLARLGFHVYAFEPLPHYVSLLRDRIRRNPQWNVTLVPVAAGDVANGTTSVAYHRSKPTVVKRGMVDDFVKEPLAVYSLDIQGGELEVLKGSTNILSSGGVQSLVCFLLRACRAASRLHSTDSCYTDCMCIDYITMKSGLRP